MMKKDSLFSKFLIYWAIIVIIMLLFTGIVNWFVNPYGIYGSPAIERINISKPKLDDHARLFQAYNLEKLEPNTVILGTSLAWEGIDPSCPAWPYPPVYNLSMNSAGIYETGRYLQHAQNVHKLKGALILLDFFAFNTEGYKSDDFKESYLSVNYDESNNPISKISQIVPTLFSQDALSSSLITVYANLIGWQKYIILENGLKVLTPTEKKDYHKEFIRVAKNLFQPTENWQFDESHTNFIQFQAYRKIIRMAYQDNIDLRLVISPFHVYQWEALEVSGSWQKFEMWKRILVSINREESQLAGKPPIPLWDFAEYNEFTTEDLPQSGDNTSAMRWYVDSAHFTRELGDLILDRVYNYHTGNQMPLDNFGTLLSVDNIDEHLLQIREDREKYEQNHSSDIAEIKDMVEKKK
jgi:hypothetical protein